MKFGGTSVGSVERLWRVVDYVQKEVEAGFDVAVVVSAMAGETNALIEQMENLVTMVDAREYDAMVAIGEQKTAAMLSMMLTDRGIPARSWFGWQIPIHTDNRHGRARIQSIDTQGIEQRFAEEQMVAVCAGFQGVSERSRITTLGRGGSDTSAVAIAVALSAQRCDIYTDVKGFYTADPRIVPKAKVIRYISYEESLELASSGAKVLQVRSVEMAMRHQMMVRVLSSFEAGEGTIVSGEIQHDDVEQSMEDRVVTGLALSMDECRVDFVGLKDAPGVAADVFKPLADAMVDVDMIVQSTSKEEQKTNMTFSIGRQDAKRVREIIEKNEKVFPFDHFLLDERVAKISLVGLGMRSHPGVAQKMFATLAKRSINILAISTSEIKVSVLIHEDYAELSMRALHTAFDLDLPQ